MRSIAIVVLGLTLGFCLTYFTLPREKGRYYDCSIAEISPDYPPEVRQECRRVRSEKIINSTIQK
jgi:hypothetical protein